MFVLLNELLFSGFLKLKVILYVAKFTQKNRDWTPLTPTEEQFKRIMNDDHRD